MTRRYAPPPEVTAAAKSRGDLRSRTAGREMTRDEKRLDRRYSAALDSFAALTRDERIERYGLPDDHEETSP